MRYVATQVGAWRVNHDAAGKIVVRAFDHRQNEVVIATATWSDDQSTSQLQTNPALPSDQDWMRIDDAVRVALVAAVNLPPDPRLDPGMVQPKSGETLKPKEKPTLLGTVGGYVTLLVLAALAVGLYFALDRFGVLDLLKRGSANGAACTIDSDCRSDNCRHKRCEANERPRGEACRSDSECRSGTCRLRICD